MNNPQTNFDERIIEVRKAYRLIYAYQQRVLDTAKRIASLIGRRIIGYYPLFTDNIPRRGGRIDDFTSWDWASMYACEFYFHNIEGAEVLHFAVAFQADTGCYDTEGLYDKELDVNRVESFADPATCGSFVYFYAGLNTWKPEKFQAIWEKDGADQSPKQPEKGDKFICRRVPLSEVMNEAGIIQTLNNMNDFFASYGMHDICKPV